MDEQEGGTEVTGGRAPAADYAPGGRRDRWRSRTEWQRQQYRVAEPGAACGDEMQPHEPEVGDA